MLRPRLLLPCIISILSIAGYASSQNAGPDLSVCNPSAYGAYTGPPLPDLPDQVTWRIEGNFVNKNYTMDFHQYIDYKNNKMALRTYTATQEKVTIFKYDTNEAIHLVIPNNPLVGGLSTTCSISDLSKNVMAQILGETDINNKTHVAKPLAGFRMSKSAGIKFLGKKIHPDGAVCNVWEGCSYNPRTYGTYKITWWFADAMTWTSAMGHKEIPVTMTVAGTTMDRTTNMMTSFDHRYNYADFRPYLSLGPITSFQIPEGVYCQNEVNTMPIPTIPKYFTLRSEKLDGVRDYVSTIKEYYDSALGLTKFEYFEAQNSQYGHNLLTIVHDFNQGVAYVMDKKHDNCSITTIGKIGYDVRLVNFTNVRIRTPKEFLDLGGTYDYVGQRVDRGIPCDVWVSSRTDYPPPGGIYATIWEQYFSADVTEVVRDQTEFSVPVKLRISSVNPPILEIYNFYDFDERETTFHNYDVSMCFPPSRKTDYVLVITTADKKLIQTNLVVFKRLLVISVTAYSYISPTRVTNIGVDFNNTGMLVTFTLLDAPGIRGDVPNPVTEPNLEGAMANLNASIDSGDFTIMLKGPAFGDDTLISLPVKSYSYFHYSSLTPSTQGKRRKRHALDDHITRVNVYKGDEGYTAGAVAGLSIGTLLGGFLIGFVVVFLVLHFKNGGVPSGVTSFENPVNEDN